MTQSEDNPYRSPWEIGVETPVQQAEHRSRRIRRMPPSSLWLILFLVGPVLLGMVVGLILELLR